MVSVSRNRLRSLAGGSAAALVAVLVAGCASDQGAYQLLQTSIRRTLDHEQAYRKVAGVDCRPHVQDVSYSAGYVHLTCAVRFNDGSAYSTPATIEARSYQVTGYNFTWNSPGQVDITVASLPRPSATAAPAAARSLFDAANLRRAVLALKRQMGRHDLVLRLVIYPGVLQAVVGSDGLARMVTIRAGGTPTAGTAVTFDGSRVGIELGQLDPRVIQHLSSLLADNGRTPIDRFEMINLPGDIAGWRIEPARGHTHYQSYLLGNDLIAIGRTGRRLS